MTNRPFQRARATKRLGEWMVQAAADPTSANQISKIVCIALTRSGNLNFAGHSQPDLPVVPSFGFPLKAGRIAISMGYV